ncbi:MAG: GNAT family N-acetyltransferase, partial [Pseudomonadota bacterium]
MARRLTLRSPRLILRAPLARDAARIAELTSDWDVARMTTRIPHPNPPAEARRFVKSVREDGRPVFGIETPADGLIGMIGYEDQALGYWLGRLWHGRGYATEAVSAMLVHVFGALGAEAVDASVFADNPASMRVLQKLGFRETGVASSASRARGAEVVHRDYRLERARWAAARSGGARAAAARLRAA